MTDELPAELAAKRERLLELMRSYGSCLVAFSGGVDSAVVAKAAQLALGNGAVAATCHSASTPAGQLEEATRLAAANRHPPRSRGYRRVVFPDYRDNGPDRCYHCKIEILTQLQRLADRLRLAVRGRRRQQRRPSRISSGSAGPSESGTLRAPWPNAAFSKAEVRELAQSWGLPWQKPASPCLSTRIAYGEQITPERLDMVDRAETFLRDRGFGNVAGALSQGRHGTDRGAVGRVAAVCRGAVPPRESSHISSRWASSMSPSTWKVFAAEA